MNVYKILFFLIAAAVIYNCSDKPVTYTIETIGGIKHYKNTGEPSAAYKPETKFLFEIKGPANVPDSMKGFGRIADLVCDDLDNIYILDELHGVVKKYNSKGEFERYFPEQSGDDVKYVKSPSQIVLLCDTVIIYGKGKWLDYLSNGQYLFSKEFYAGGTEIGSMKSNGRDYMAAFCPKKRKDRTDSIYYFSNNLHVLSRRFEPQTVIKNIKKYIDDKFYFPDIMTSFALKNDIFYVADNEGSAYRIYAINARGISEYVIEKSNKDVPYNNYEMHVINEMNKTYGFNDIDTTAVYYKKPVSAIEIDRNNRLWVKPTVFRTENNKDSTYIDIFSEGIFINRTVLDFVTGNETFKLAGNFLFVISADGRSVRVYSYE